SVDTTCRSREAQPDFRKCGRGLDVLHRAEGNEAVRLEICAVSLERATLMGRDTGDARFHAVARLPRPTQDLQVCESHVPGDVLWAALKIGKLRQRKRTQLGLVVEACPHLEKRAYRLDPSGAILESHASWRLLCDNLAGARIQHQRLRRA